MARARFGDPVTIDTTDFEEKYRRLLERQAPQDAVHAINEVAKEVRRELVKASPRGRRPNKRRRELRAIKGTLYGPIRRGWQRTRMRRLDQPARVFNKVFYARMVEIGTAKMGPRRFVAPVARRLGAIAEKVFARLFPANRG